MKSQRRMLIKWSVPVITTIALPAHAQTSINTLTTSATCTINSVTPSSATLDPGDSFIVNVTYSVVNPPPTFQGIISASTILIGITNPPGTQTGFASPSTNIDNTTLSGTINLTVPYTALANIQNAPGVVTSDTVNVFIGGNTLSFPNPGSQAAIGTCEAPVNFIFNPL